MLPLGRVCSLQNSWLGKLAFFDGTGPCLSVFWAWGFVRSARAKYLEGGGASLVCTVIEQVV